MKIFKIRRVYIGILIGAIFLATLLIANEHFFTVQKVIISATNKSDSKKLISVRGLTTIYQKKIFFLSKEKIKKQLLDTNPLLKSVDIQINYPSQVSITCVFYTSSAYLQVNEGYFMLGEDGRILEKTKTLTNKNLPIIRYYQQLDYYAFQSGDIITYKDVTTSLRLLTKMSDLGFIINNIDINGLSMIVLNSKDKRFIFTTEKDISEQEYQFSAIVRKFRQDKKDFKSLDLRFDKPVISL